MQWTREYCFVSKDTFSMKPLKNLFYKYFHQENPELVVDPFARNCNLADLTNDIDPTTKAEYHLEASDFLKDLPSNSADIVLFDPPFTSRQVKECYNKLGRTVNWEDTQNTYWTKIKNEIMRVLRPGGVCITCGYNSNGIGKSRGFEIIEGMNIAHGAMHHDTIIVVERKVQVNLF